MGKARRSLPKRLWAYAYEIVPPRPSVQLSAIQTLLETEHAEAQRTARTWTGKVVCEPKATHILVVSDSPDQSREVNRRLEGRLKRWNAAFALTLPLAIADEDEAPPRNTVT